MTQPASYLAYRFWQIAKPFFTSEVRWKAWGLLCLLILLSLSVNGSSVLINYATGDMMTALSELNQSGFYRSVLQYSALLILVIPIVVFYRFTEESLVLLWRTWLTDSFLSKYLTDRAYYKISLERRIDNPDQRITDEVRAFTATSLSFLLIVINSIIALIAFFGVLWTISPLLSGVLMVYALLGSIGTAFLGKRLVSLNFNQLRLEADLRYSLINLRDNSESIAFYRGEAQEGRIVRGRLREALRNFNAIIIWTRNLGFFTTSYGYIANILPLIIVAPMFLHGDIKFGAIAQATSASAHVLGAVSLIVQQFERLSHFFADVNRLAKFKDVLEVPSKNNDRKLFVGFASYIKLENLTLYTPRRQRKLFSKLNLTLPDHGRLLITGGSGTGKSSLLRVVAGLWDCAEGRIYRPSDDQLMFIPQRPYTFVGTLEQQLLYGVRGAPTTAAIKDALQKVGLTRFIKDNQIIQSELDWPHILSLGEQQRVAFARLILSASHIKVAFLDEATSAVELESEMAFYENLKTLGLQFVSVGHRESLRMHHTHELILSGDNNSPAAMQQIL